MIKMQYLVLRSNKKITDEGIIGMIHLKKLDLYDNYKITKKIA
jgi:hypothetical protein